MLPNELYEHIICRHYSWSLDAVRAMNMHDFKTHLEICLVREDIEREFQMALVGVKPDTAAPPVPDIPKKGSGTIRKVEKKNLLHF